MASTGKAAMKLATAQALTGSLVVTSTVSSFSISDESIATLDFTYTTGAAEAGTTCQFQVEHSYNETDWVIESISSLSGSTDTLTNLIHTFGGGAGATAYTTQYVIPLCSRFMRVKVKETGSPGNAGSLTVVLTTASGSGQSRNLLSPGAGSATTDVNLVEVGGAVIALGQTTMAGSLPIAIASDQSVIGVGGNIAHDSADSGNPVKIGGKALTAPATAVTANDRVNGMFDVYGRQITMAGLREMKVTQITTITASTAETTILSSDATYKLDVYAIIVNNTSATATEIAVRDATAGTIRFWVACPANDVRGFCLPMDAGHNQSAAANNWTAQAQDSVSSLVITVFAIKNL